MSVASDARDLAMQLSRPPDGHYLDVRCCENGAKNAARDMAMKPSPPADYYYCGVPCCESIARSGAKNGVSEMLRNGGMGLVKSGGRELATNGKRCGHGRSWRSWGASQRGAGDEALFDIMGCCFRRDLVKCSSGIGSCSTANYVEVRQP